MCYQHIARYTVHPTVVSYKLDLSTQQGSAVVRIRCNVLCDKRSLLTATTCSVLFDCDNRCAAVHLTDMQ
jgi:hypothetical protein